MAAVSPQNKGTANDRNRRIVKRLFPNAESFVFANDKGGFVSFPILMRKLLKHLKPTQLELLVYLWLRSDKYGLCYPTLEAIAHELGQQNTTRLKKIVRELEQDLRLIKTHTHEGRIYFLVGDPRHAVVNLRKRGIIDDAGIDDANELLGQLKLPLIPKGSAQAESK
jgi:hypothetical protein